MSSLNNNSGLWQHQIQVNPSLGGLHKKSLLGDSNIQSASAGSSTASSAADSVKLSNGVSASSNNYFAKSLGSGQGNGMAGIMQMFMTMMMQMFSMFSQFGNGSSNGNYDQGNDNDYDNGNCNHEPPVYEPPVEEPPVYEPPVEEPPVYEPPVEEPPVYEPPVEPPVYPPVEEEKVNGSAGLFGDPKFGLFSSNIVGAPEALKSFESNIKAGQTVSVLKDSDNGGFQVDVTTVQVDPANKNSSGVGRIEVPINGQDVKLIVNNNGDIIKQAGDSLQVLGNIKDAGLLGEIDLGNGIKVSTGLRIDDAQGNKKERVIIKNGEYEVTAALRSPHPDSKNYFDMNFEELKDNSADNATGYQTTVAGFDQKFGIADLLRIEPDDVDSLD